MFEWVLLEDRKQSARDLPGLFFKQPVNEVICWDGAELVACLHRLDQYRRQGYYLVGFISYEAGYSLQGLNPDWGRPRSVGPLLHFLVFETMARLSSDTLHQTLAQCAAQEPAHYSIKDVRLNRTFDEYEAAFHIVKHHIREGDTYQVNLTCQYAFDFDGSPVRLYQRLRERQKVAYSGLLSFNDYQVLSLSPELFFSKTGPNMCVKPMKGTMPRAMDPLVDAEYKRWLQTDAKSRAENIMIVDLLRNDLAAFSVPGSVKASQLLHVESYETVHQMVSCVESQVDSELPFAHIIHALFPCGSITGAPKRRTMEIIHAIEPGPRGVYTGAMGYILPNNDMCFNVCIRTLFLHHGRGTLGVGGGIVHDSVVQSEFEEMQLKGRFFTELSEAQA